MADALPEGIQNGRDLLPLVRKLEGADDDFVSPAGAVGRYQIKPGTARQYGFDPEKLTDPKYSEQVAGTILDKMWSRYHGDPQSTLVGYNAGATVADRWNAFGRTSIQLTPEARGYLNKAAPYLKIGGQPMPTYPVDLAPQPPAAPVTGQAPVAPGRADYQKLLDGGFSAQEADAWKQNQTSQLMHGGFTPKEIDAHWGEGEPNSSDLEDHIRANLSAMPPEQAQKVAGNFVEGISVGWGQSVPQLIKNQGKLATVLPENPSMGMRVAAGIGELAGNLPIMGTGAILGAEAGAPFEAAAGPYAPVVAAGFAGGGAFGLPSAMRELVLDSYKRGEVHTFGDFMQMASKSMTKVAKDFTTGALTVATGGVVGGGVAAAGGSPLLAGAADLGTQAATMTSVGAALDGKVADASDYAASAVMVLGLHAAGKATGATGRIVLNQAGKAVESRLQDAYAQSGIPPWTLAREAATNRVVRDELLAEDVNGDAVMPTINKNAVSEPEPGVEPPKAEITEPAKEELNAPPPRTETDKALDEHYGALQTVAAAHEAAGNAVPPSITNALENIKVEAKQRGFELTEPGKGGGGSEPPEVTPPGQGSPKMGPGPKLGPEVLNQIANEYVGEPAQKPDTFWTRLKDFYRQAVSELGPARDIDKMLLDKGYDLKRQMGLEDMLRQTYASDARTGYFVRKGGISVRDGMADDGTTSVMDAMKAAKEDGGNMNDWRNYMVAQRTVIKERAGFETGHPLTIDQRIELINAGEGKYERATQMLNETLDSVLRYGRDSGVFSEKQIRAMMRDNPAYISLRRIMGDMATAPKAGRRGFRVSEPVHTYEGADGQVLDPIMATIDNIAQIVRMADRNRAAGWLVGAAETKGVLGLDADGLNELGLRRLSAAEVKATIAEPGSTVFKPYSMEPGIGHNGGPELDDLTGTYSPFLAARAMRGTFEKNQFMFIRDGKPEFWVAKDEALATLIRGADSPGETNAIVKFAQSVAQWQRAGIVGAIDFPTRITLRHQITAFIADPLSPPPFITWLRGAFDAFSGGPAFDKLVRNGGVGTALVEMDRDTIQTDMQKVFNETGVFDRMWNVVRHPLEAAQWVSERMDAGARIGYQAHAEAQGLDPLKAATMGRKAMLDYTEKGTNAFLQSWARMVPFMRPNILGLKQFSEAFSERPGPTLLKTLAAVAMPSLVFYGLNYLQDEYTDIPEAEKFKNINRYLKDGLFILPQVGGVRLRMPTPYVVGPLFNGLTNRILDRFVRDDPKAFDEWIKLALAEIIPPFIPSIVVPPLEHYMNKHFNTGKAMIPGSLEGTSGQMQYTEATTEPARILAQYISPLAPQSTSKSAAAERIGDYRSSEGGGVDVSPIVIENYVRGWTGTIGMAVMKVLDAPFHMSGRPWEMSDIPFVSSFFMRHPGSSAQPIQDFFEDRAKMAVTLRDEQVALRRAKMGADNEVELNNAVDNMQPMQAINRAAEMLHMHQDAIIAAYHDKTMTDKEKGQFVDDLVENMIVTSKSYSELMRQMREARK